jgi:hypothetical protein
VTLQEEMMPFNVRILQLSTSGEGEVVLDNTDLVVSRLVDLGLTDVLPGEEPGQVKLGDPDVDDPGGEGPASMDDPDAGSEAMKRAANDARTSDGGCALRSSSGGANPLSLGALFTAGLMWVRRRRLSTSA